MKKFIIFIAIIIIIVFLLHLAFFTFFNIKGKDILIQQVKKNLGQDLVIDSLSLKFPFDIEAKGVRFPGLELRKVDVSVVWFNPFTYRLTLDKVYLDGLKARINIDKDKISIGDFLIKDLSEAEKKEDKIIDKTIGSVLEEDGPKKIAARQSPAGKVISLAIRKIQMVSSTAKINYLNKSNKVEVVLDRINLDLQSFTYPELSNFYVKFTSYISSMQESQAESDMLLTLDGWIDYANKNMNLGLSIDNFDYFSFKDYYPNFWKPENLYIKETILSLDSQLTSKNNNLVIDNELSLDKIIFEEVQEGEEVPPKVKTFKTIIAILQGNKEKPIIRFSIKTKMDSPKLDFSSFQQVIKDVIPMMPAVILEETVGKTVDKVTKNINETIGKTSEITVDAIVDTLKSVVDTISGKLNLPVDSKGEESQETPQN